MKSTVTYLPVAAALIALVITVALTRDYSDAPPPGLAKAMSPVDWNTVHQNRDFFPQPIGHVLEDGSEKLNKKRRKAWFSERHRAPPRVDYKQVERINGLMQTEKRNQLALAPATAMDTDAPIPEWAERGSSNQAGRMHVATHSSNQTLLYAGSAMGGIWIGEMDGSDWTPIGDNLFGGAHHMVTLSGEGSEDPDIVLAAADWGAIHRTTDNGQTWEVPGGLEDSWNNRRILKTSEGSETVFVLMNTYWEMLLMRSTDGATSFTSVYDFDEYPGDVWTARDGGNNSLYIIDAGQILRSDDLGDNWTPVGDVGASSDEAELVGSEAGAPRLWAVLHDGNVLNLHRSDDAGATWTFVTIIEDYWRSLAASITNQDVFVWGGVEVFRTDDGGATFELVNSWGEYYADPVNMLHADVPGIDVLLDGAGQELWYISTDGGLYHSIDLLATVYNLSTDGLRVSQYYSTLTNAEDPERVSAGSQDQGYQICGPDIYTEDLIEFDQVMSGDYGHLTSGDGTHEYVFSVYPGFILAQVGLTDPPAIIFMDFPANENFAWLPPVVADPQNNEDFFFCGTHLYHYELEGSTWTHVLWSSLDVSTEDPDEYISALEFSPVNPLKAYMATNRGRLFYSSDRGVTWTQSASTGPEAHYFYGTALLASITDADTVWVGGSGYGSPAVYMSTDGGQTWEPHGQGLPDTLVYCLGEAPDGSGRVFAGVETSAYQRDPDSDEWYDITGNTAPITIYWSIEALTAENTMRFGTYGRGIWDYRLDPDHLGCYPVQDYDGDGVDCETDCDDHDKTIYPGALDECDGVDVNCDPDDPVETDGDEDGFLACEDCDDGNPAVNPSAQEICDNGIDDDCDGVIDSCYGFAATSGDCACDVTPGRTFPSLIVLVLESFF